MLLNVLLILSSNSTANVLFLDEKWDLNKFLIRAKIDELEFLEKDEIVIYYCYTG